MTTFDRKKGARAYEQIRENFRQSSKFNYEELVQLCKKSEFNIDIEAKEFWSRIWDKPLYANTKVQQGDKDVSLLKDTLLANNFKKLSSDAWNISKIKIPKNHWTKNDAYKLEGTEIISFFKKKHIKFTDFNNVKREIPRFRIKQIRDAASGLSKLAEETQFPLKKIFELAGVSSTARDNITEITGKDYMKLHKIMRNFFKLGPITTDHALTDLGLGIKPDIWLTRRVVNMGWYKTKISPNASDEEVKIFFNNRINVCQVFDDVISIVNHVKPLKGCENNPLREIDYILMQSHKFGV